jgi:hypothetical protein
MCVACYRPRAIAERTSQRTGAGTGHAARRSGIATLDTNSVEATMWVKSAVVVSAVIDRRRNPHTSTVIPLRSARRPGAARIGRAPARGVLQLRDLVSGCTEVTEVKSAI